MAEPTDETPSQQSRRNLWTWLVVGVVVVAIGTGVLVALTRTGSNPPADPDQPQVVITLNSTGEPAGRCMLPTPEDLADKPLAFAGTVSAVDDSTATITVSKLYAGGPADVVRVRFLAPGLVTDQAIDFAPGEQVLVAAVGSRVAACGYSGQATADLQQLYDQAFGG